MMKCQSLCIQGFVPRVPARDGAAPALRSPLRFPLGPTLHDPGRDHRLILSESQLDFIALDVLEVWNPIGCIHFVSGSLCFAQCSGESALLWPWARPSLRRIYLEILFAAPCLIDGHLVCLSLFSYCEKVCYEHSGLCGVCCHFSWRNSWEWNAGS